MTIIAIGPHPDDPEEGMGGTLARIKHLDTEPTDERMIIVYMTSGGAGIGGKSQTDACAIREQEAKNACKMLHAEPLFLHQIDGAAFPTEETVKALQELFEKEEPRMIFTCWPLDTHPDHRATAYMVITAYSRIYGNSFTSSIHSPMDAGSDPLGMPPLFFWSTEINTQSLNFHPDVYVNIESCIDLKMELVETHTSQNRHDSLVHWVEKDGKTYAEPPARSRFAEGFMRMRPPLM